MVGVILQSSAVNLAHMLAARLCAGCGVAFIIVIASEWTAELSSGSAPGQKHRVDISRKLLWH
jgi:predicted MFS family arabinose efflux permease